MVGELQPIMVGSTGLALLMCLHCSDLTAASVSPSKLSNAGDGEVSVLPKGQRFF